MKTKWLKAYFLFLSEKNWKIGLAVSSSHHLQIRWWWVFCLSEVHPVFILLTTPHQHFISEKLWVSKENTEHCYKKVRTENTVSCLFIFRHTLLLVTSKLMLMCNNNYQLYLHYFSPNANTLMMMMLFVQRYAMLFYAIMLIQTFSKLKMKWKYSHFPLEPIQIQQHLCTRSV